MTIPIKANYYQNHHPTPAEVDLVIEVADTSLSYDSKVKSVLYAEASIPNYWIINLEEGCIETYAQPAQETYQFAKKHFPGDKITFPGIKTAYAVEDLLIT